MSDPYRILPELPPEQQAIRAKCFHPSGAFVEFTKEEIEQSIPARFEQQVGKYPERIAVQSKNHTLTYEALNRAANRAARAILAICGEEQQPVALLLANDAPMIVAMMGVLKARKFYVQIDPSHPPARIKDILEDSQAALVLT
ncbi:MAG: AMP-binding protein, partial [Candidatus Binatia bacterium]